MSNTRKASGPTEPLDVDVLIAESTFEPYRFILGKKDHELPHPKTLTWTQLVQADSGDLETVLPEVTDPETATALLGLPNFALEKVIEGWLKHAGVDLGELKASLRS